MLIYNTTYLVGNGKAADWKKWIEEIHIPFMQKTGKFFSPQIAKILYSDNADAVSFSVQFKIKDLESLGVWSELYSDKLQSEITEMFGDEVLPFSTVMEIIE